MTCDDERNKTEQVLLEIWREVLGDSDIGIDEDFFARGGTSVQAALMFTAIEQRLGQVLPISMLFDAGSVRALASRLDSNTPGASGLVAMQRAGTNPPILAASGIGGNVVGLAHLARAMGEQQPFYGLQSKALSGATDADTSIEQIAATVIDESEAVRKPPFVLFGVCFGANVMLEAAHQLRGLGQRPSLLIVLDPVFGLTDERGHAVPVPRTVSRHFAVANLVQERTRDWFTRFKALNHRDRLTFLRDKSAVVWTKLKHRNLAYGNEYELRQRQVEAANLHAATSYCPQPFDGEVRVLITGDREIDTCADPRLRWIQQLAPNAATATIPGRDTGDALHNYASVIAEQLQAWLTEATHY